MRKRSKYKPKPVLQDPLKMDEYTHKTYGTARFHILDGWYSIEEIEALLVEMKAAETRTEESLKRVIKPLKENT
jgi:hypothetical protein